MLRDPARKRSQLKSTNYRMPACTARDVAPIEAAVRALRGASRDAAEDLMDATSPRGLCMMLHAIRRWYSYNCYNAAKKILVHAEALHASGAMDLRAPVGAFRGFKVALDNPLARHEAGDRLALPVVRNGGCSSWTMRREIADRFSGASPGKTGIVIRLLDDRVEPFIAPPLDSAAWFNALYARTMGSSFRLKEDEYALYGSPVHVEIVAMKRR